MNILAAILDLKMAAMKNNFVNIFIIRTLRMVIFMSKHTFECATNAIVK